MPTETPERSRADSPAALASREPGPRDAGPRLGADRWVAPGLGLGFLLLYLRTLCPTVYMGDSGEICTAIATGGVTHPPGYPLFSLLGRAALVLVPFGEPAFRIGCVVALAGALAVLALYFLAREIGCSPGASAVGAAAFGAGHTFWSQATRVEVYSLHVLLFALVLLAGLRYRRSGQHRHLAAAALVGSLGLAHHLTIALLFPALLVLCGQRLWKEPWLGRRLKLLGALLPLGPALYLLLLVWARAEPLHAWGGTVNLTQLWHHASARVFRGLLQVPEYPCLAFRLARAGTLFMDNFPFLAFTLPLVGAWVLWKRDRVIGSALILTAAVVTAYNLCYQIEDIAGYYLPVWMVAALWMAAAVEALRDRCASVSGTGRWMQPVGSGARHPARGTLVVTGALCALIPGVLLARNWSACDLSRAVWVREFARYKLENAAQGGVLITQDDQDTNPLWYVHDVLNVRPDVVHVDRGACIRAWRDYDWDRSLWYLHRLRRQGVNAPIEVPRDRAARARLRADGYLIQLLDRELRGRPLYITFTRTAERKREPPLFRWMRQRYVPLPWGIIMSLRPKSEPVVLAELVRQNERLWSRMMLPDLRGARLDEELNSGYFVNHYACMLLNFGGLHEMAGNVERAEAIYRRAIEWAPHDQAAQNALLSLHQVQNAKVVRPENLKTRKRESGKGSRSRPHAPA
jgi:hypothetical protein